jgi:UPF0755 protein
MKKMLASFLLIAVVLIGAFIFNSLRPVGGENEKKIVMIGSSSPDAAAINLEDKGVIRSFTAFSLLYQLIGNGKIEPGGYYVSKNMNSLDIIKKMNNGADLKQITIPEGLRKEQIGERLQALLGWSDKELKEWDNVYSQNNKDYKEGVYFPDTYLIPVKETPVQVANRMIANFNDKFASYQNDFTNKNIRWTTGLKIASLIQREAAGESDMPLIAGVIWNRLEAGQALQIDATIQYAKGKTNDLWWPPVTGKDIKIIDSPYNSYKYAGLPPAPISNPGLSAIKAALNPAGTDCLYYLHDHSRQIHCAKTYEEHLENIEKYLN